MLRKRIIFTLIYSDNFFVQSRNFRLQKVGNIHWIEKNYQLQKISFSLDELIVLNASRTSKSIHDFAKIVNRLTDDVFIPVAAGGGIRTMEDAEVLFNHGADKIVLNSALYNDINLVRELVERYGSQAIVASIDYKGNGGTSEVFILDGTRKIDLTLSDYLDYVRNLKIGEIYLNSIDQDGTGFGYDFETIQAVKENIDIPLIIAGGAGNEHHLFDGLNLENINAVATANLFNFLGDSLPNARKKIIERGMNLAAWEYKAELHTE